MATMNLKKTLFSAVLAVAAVAVSGCDATIDPGGAVGPRSTLDERPSKFEWGDAPRCDMGKKYIGFAGTDLTADRVDGDIGDERARTKPFSAMANEYQRVLGNRPALLNGAAATFGIEPNRWLVEPKANAVSLYTSFRIAFQGCLTSVQSPAKYGTDPDAATAATECRDWATKFWSRTPLQPEVDACVKVATQDTAAETNSRRRWAYACASVLSASDFLTY